MKINLSKKAGLKFFIGAFLATLGISMAAISIADAPVDFTSKYIKNNLDGSQTLTGHVPREVKDGTAVFLYHASQNISARIIMPLENQSQLDSLLGGLYDPKSPDFHHFLTPAQFAQQFSSSTIDSTLVQEFLKNEGVSVTGQSANGAVLNVTGPVRAFEHAFGLHINNYQKNDGTLFFAPDQDPTIPATLAGKMLAIGGLDNLAKYVAHRQQSMALPKAIGSGPGGFLSPGDVKTAYNLNSVAATGSGQNVDLFELDGYSNKDITAYESQFNLPNLLLQNVLIDGFSGVPDYGSTGGADEVTLDIELLTAFAPGSSNIYVYEAPNTTKSWIDEWTKIAQDNKAKVISCSWGEPEQDSVTLSFDNQIFQQMAVQGQAVFAAAGDDGAYDTDGTTLGVDEPASQPYATAVGISKLTANANGTYNSEEASVYGGGGVSAYWTIPSYQTTAVSQALKAAKVSTTMRNVPDVVLTADASTPYAFYINGSWNGYYGSSVSTPVWASFMSRVNQGLGVNAPIGSVNTALYQLAQNSNYTNDFHEISTGNNGYYPAEPGFNDATGLGSFNGFNLYNDLVNQALAITAPVVSTGPGTTTGTTTQPTGNNPAPTNTTDPSVPTALAVIGTTATQIDLMWSASTDPSTGPGQASAVAGYNIYRGGVKIGTSPTNYYSDTGLNASTSYTYTVSAYDAAGDASTPSSPVSAVTGNSSILPTKQAQVIPILNTWTVTNAGGFPSQPVGYEKSVWINSPALQADCIQTNYLTRGVTSEIQDAISCYDYARNWTSIVEQGGGPHSSHSFPGGHEVSVTDYYAPADALILQSDDSYGNSVETMSDLWTWYVGGETVRDTPFPAASNNSNQLTRFWRADGQLNMMACDQVNGKCLTFPDFRQSGTAGTGTICTINSSGLITSCEATSAVGIPSSLTNSANMRWDADNQLFYIWGGTGNLTAMTTYNDATNTWATLATTCTGPDCVGTAPPARQCAGMDYSTTDHVFLLVGGGVTTSGCSSTTATSFTDTWKFNPSTNAWTELCGPSMSACGYPNPEGALSFDRLTYDPVDNVFILIPYTGPPWVYALSTPQAFGRTTPAFNPTAGSLNRTSPGSSNTTQGNSFDISSSASGATLYIAHAETGPPNDISYCQVPTAYISSVNNTNTLTWIQSGTTQDQACASMRYGEKSLEPMSHVFTANIAGTQWAIYEKHNAYSALGAGASRSYFQQFINGSWYGGWAPQTTGGTLVAGSNTVTLSPMPAGVGVDSQLVIDQITTGASSSEYVQVTAATPSTVTFTTNYAHTGTWTIASSGLVDCFTRDCSSVTVDPKMRSYPEGLISVGGVPTVSFMEENDNLLPHAHNVFVAQFAEGAFSNLGSGPLNITTNSHATYASAPATDGAGNIAECWTEEVDSASEPYTTLTTTPQVYCKLWNGTAWSQMGSGSLNQTASDWTYTPNIEYWNGQWYLAYTESSLTGNLLLYVLEYNAGSNTWSVVGSGPLNINASTGLAYDPSLTAGTSNLYVGWEEQASTGQHSLAYVDQWNGSSWSQLGGVLNADPVNGSAEGISLTTVSGEPTAVWGELTYGNLKQVYTKQWNGVSWGAISNGGPTVPTSLAASAISTTQINLAWNASTDNLGVAGYNIYRGGVQVGTSTSTSYSDTGLTPSTAYTYTVGAYDTAGNTSAQSGSAGATTQAAVAPVITSFTSSAATDVAGQPVTLSWAVTGAPAPALSINNGVGAVTGTSVSVSPTATTTYTLTATNSAGSVTNTVTITVPPSVPTGLTATVVSATNINVSWTASTDSAGVAGYNIYRGGVQVTTSTTTSYSDTSLTPSTAYSYTVSAYDTAGNTSAQSGSAGATTQAAVAPVITSFTSSAATDVAGQPVTLSWAVTGAPAPALSINNGVGAVTGTSVSVSPTATTTYTLTATNSAGSVTNTVTITVPPSVPTGLTATVVSATNINVSWTASTDSAGVAGYNIYRGGVQVTTSTTTSYSDTSLTPSTAYSYTVSAYDALGNTSAQSSAVSATTLTAIVPVITSFTSSTATVAAGQPVTLSWAVTGAPAAVLSINNGVGTLTGTSVSVSPTATTTYTLTATNLAGSVTSTVTIAVPPSVPTGLTVTALHYTKVNLSWTASTDSSGVVAGYNIYRGGVQVGTSTTTSYCDTGLIPATSYSYTVSAYDAAGNASAQSSAVSATTLAAVVPVITSFTSSTATVVAGQPVTLSWAVTGAPAPALSINNGVGTVTGTSVSVSPTATTTYTLTATNLAGSVTSTVTIAVPPSVPTGLTAAAVSATKINLSWTASTDSAGVAGYNIYRGGVQVATSTTNAYTDRGLTPLTAYTYTVSAYDAAGNTSAQSSSVSATTLAAMIPVITSFSASALTITAGQSTTLTWTVTATPWPVFSIDNNVGTVKGRSVSVSPTTTTTYTLTATNSAGSASNTVTITVNPAPPSVPTGLTVTAVHYTKVNLSWTASTDSSGVVAGYNIYRGGVQVGTSTTTSYCDTGLTPATSYSYTVSAYDALGNTSAQSSAVSATTLTAIVPVITSFTSSTATVAAGQPVTLSWAVTGAPAAVLSINNGVGTLTGTSVSVSPTATTTYTLTATNLAGSVTSTVTIAVPPSVPTGLTVTALHYTKVNLSWTASTDSSGVVAGYNIYRGGVQVGTSTTTSYCDTGLIPATSYSYTVSAYDAAGNASAQSSAVSATTLAAVVPVITSFTSSTATVVAGQPVTLSWAVTGAPAPALSINNGVGAVTGTSVSVSPTATTTYTLTATNSAGSVTNTVTITVPPSVPTGLTAAAVSATKINLSWTASTDSAGVAGYNIYRGGVQVATSTTNAYTDRGLTPLTAYTYTVSAYDAAGNTSAQSSAANATTLQTETITASAGANGTISPSGAVSVNYGANQTFTVTPSTGYTASLTVDGSAVTLTNNTYTLSNVTAAHTVAASFILQTETITASAGANGTISPSGAVSVNYGANQTFTVTPSTGYTASLTVDGSAVTLTNNTYTLSNVTAAHTVAASFILQTETITASAGANGTISPSGAVSVNYGANQTFTVTPNTGYTASLTVDGSAVTLTNNTYTLSNVTAAHTVAASFILQTETITASAGANGTISPSGAVSVNYGANQTFTVTPSTGYTASLTVDGSAVTLTNNTYTLSNVTANHTVMAAFTKPIAFVNAASANSTHTPETVSLNLTTGNLVVVLVSANGNGNGCGSITVTDTASNTYTQAGGLVSQKYNCTGIFYAKNITGGSSVTINATFSTNSNTALTAMQFSGLNTSSPLDVTASAASSSSPVTSGAFSTAGANELIVAGVGNYDNGAFTAGTVNGSSMTIPTSGSVYGGSTGMSVAGEYIIESSAVSSKTASMSAAGTVNLNMNVAAFKQAS